MLARLSAQLEALSSGAHPVGVAVVDIVPFVVSAAAYVVLWA